MDFKYRVFSLAKNRKERVRTHISEWAQDILNFLSEHNGTWAGSQADLAKALSAPLRSIKEALKGLIKAVKISVNVNGKGRGARSVITQIAPSKTVKIFPVFPSQQSSNNSFKPMPATKRRIVNEIVHSRIHPISGSWDTGLFQRVVRGSPDSS